MSVLLLILIGIAGGIIGGMGMGGGTLLIPLMTLLAGVEQHTAQAINLAAFIPMSAVALAVHLKNKLIDFKYLLWVALPAVAASVAAAYLSRAVGGRALSRWFGIFLIVLGLYQLGTILYNLIRTIKFRRKSFTKGGSVWYNKGRTNAEGVKNLKNTFSRGVHPQANKAMTERKGIETVPAPAVVYIPVAQHIGKTATPVVRPGDTVKMGQLIAMEEGKISANIFSSVSGTVKAIEKRATASGRCDHIVIENDGQYVEDRLEPLDNPDRAQIIERVRYCGIVGMGGAGFPTEVKLDHKTSVDTFIVNGAECEPYITCDHRIMLEYTDNLIRGALLLAEAAGVRHATFAVEENKPDAIAKLNESIARNNFNAEVVPVVTKYPQGAEKQLIYAVTRRKVPVGKLPAAVGCVVNNVHTALSAYLAVKEGQTLYKRIMTVTGGGVVEPKNVWVSNGTLYADLLAFCGGEKGDIVKMINGGPMMGVAVAGAEIAATKTTSCLLLLTREEANTAVPGPCINCARCAKVCPMKLMPMFIDACALSGDMDGAVKYGALNCIECGSCAYVCPAKRPLVQSIRLAKKKVREAKK